MLKQFKLQWSGEACLTVVFSHQIEVAANQAIRSFQKFIEDQRWTWLLETQPTYGGLTLFMDPVEMDDNQLSQALEAYQPIYSEMLHMALSESDDSEQPIFEIPVCYGGTYGPDLERVAAHCGLSVSEVIERHTAPAYLIYMLGFTPGFPYMGGMDEGLSTPRLDKPRTVIPEGAVGIAGNQTGIYPMASPGGWNLIGQTPLKLFDPLRTEPALLKAGMWVKYKAISEEAFLNWVDSEKAHRKDEVIL